MSRTAAVVARYFEMWNTGDTSIAAEILSKKWIDHSHPEVSGIEGVRRSVESVRAARPSMRFTIDAMLSDGSPLVGAVGRVRLRSDSPSSQMVWLFEVRDGRLAQLWTYRQASRF